MLAEGSNNRLCKKNMAKSWLNISVLHEEVLGVSVDLIYIYIYVFVSKCYSCQTRLDESHYCQLY